jgi:hypothetical protein
MVPVLSPQGGTGAHFADPVATSSINGPGNVPANPKAKRFDPWPKSLFSVSA